MSVELFQALGITTVVATIVGAMFVRSLRRSEAARNDAEAGKARAETDSVVVRAAREIVEEYRTQYAEISAAQEKCHETNAQLAAGLRAVYVHLTNVEQALRSQGLPVPDRPAEWPEEFP